MAGTVLTIVIYLALIFAAVIVARVAEEDTVIGDADFWIILSIFIPLGVILILSAFYVSQRIIDRRDARRYHERYDGLK